jgi:putative membrane protein
MAQASLKHSGESSIGKSRLSGRDAQVQLAAERTLLAWVRTGLALMGFGFVVARFGLFLHELAGVRGEAVVAGHGYSLWIGVGLVAMGVWVLSVSAMRFRRYTTAIRAGREMPPPGPQFALGVATVLAAIAVAMIVYLLHIS